MISNAEPCLVVSIQNQLTLCIGTMIVRQIQVARKPVLLFGDCAVIIMNSLFKLFEILEWIIRIGGFDAKKLNNKKTKNK